MSRLIAALGNPGSEYDGTRHNIGWDILNYLSFENNIRWQDKYKGVFGPFDHEKGGRIYFLKPMTFMNLSGESVQPAANFFKIPPEDILVLHDELDLPFGTIAFKSGGGLAGHNGLKSIAEKLGTKNFKRMRLGIGRPQKGNVTSWVLSKYDTEQREWFGNYMQEAAKALELYCRSGFDRASSKYSKKTLIEWKEN